MILCPHCGERIGFVQPAGLTPRQAAMLAFIKNYTAANEASPSFAEIAAACGLRSRGYVSKLVGVLAERGHVRVLPNRARSIVVIERIAA